MGEQLEGLLRGAVVAQHHDPDGLTDSFPRLDRRAQILPLASGFDGDARVDGIQRHDAQGFVVEDTRSASIEIQRRQRTPLAGQMASQQTANTKPVSTLGEPRPPLVAQDVGVWTSRSAPTALRHGLSPISYWTVSTARANSSVAATVPSTPARSNEIPAASTPGTRVTARPATRPAVARSESRACSDLAASASTRATSTRRELPRRTLAKPGEKWPEWYAAYMVAERTGGKLPQ